MHKHEHSRVFASGFAPPEGALLVLSAGRRLAPPGSHGDRHARKRVVDTTPAEEAQGRIAGWFLTFWDGLLPSGHMVTRFESIRSATKPDEWPTPNTPCMRYLPSVLVNPVRDHGVCAWGGRGR